MTVECFEFVQLSNLPKILIENIIYNLANIPVCTTESPHEINITKWKKISNAYWAAEALQILCTVLPFSQHNNHHPTQQLAD